MQRINASLPVYFYGTGSSGNSLYIEPIRFMIDLGFTYKNYKPEHLANLDVLALTHKHGDHLTLTALDKILMIHPYVKILVPNVLMDHINEKRPDLYERAAKQFKIIDFNCEYPMCTRDGMEYILRTYATKHGELINIAYDIEIPQMATRLLYASDLESTRPSIDGQVKGLPQNTDIKYNLMFLEANYDEKIIKDELKALEDALYQERLKLNAQPELSEYILAEIKALSNLKTRTLSNYRHLSEQSALDYMQTHLTDNGIFIPLHGSSSFGNFIQHLKKY